MLQRLYIDNHQCLVNFELNLDRMTLLVGRNGVGKSAVVDILSRLRWLASGEARCEEAFPRQSLTWWQSRTDQTYELDVVLNDGLYRYRLVVEHDLERQLARIRSETVTLDGESLLAFEGGRLTVANDRQTGAAEFRLDWSRSALGFVLPRPDNQKLMAFRDWLLRLSHLRLNPFVMNPMSETEATRLEPSGENFASWYRALVLEDPARAAELVTMLEPALPGLVRVGLEREGRVRALNLTFREPGNNGSREYTCALDDLSEGQRALLVLYALRQMVKDQPGMLLCIDEPDNFIALSEIDPWLWEMRREAEDGVYQLVITSHHPEVMNAMADQAVLLARDGLAPTRVMGRPFQEPLLSLGETVARGWEDG